MARRIPWARHNPREQAISRELLQELDEKAKSALGAKGSGLPPTTVVERLRKRLRMNGYRCHLTLQACVSLPPQVLEPEFKALLPPRRSSSACAGGCA